MVVCAFIVSTELLRIFFFLIVRTFFYLNGSSSIQMHGIKKTEVTEAERDAKTKERERKLQLYVKYRDLIFDKIRKGVFDEEGLVLTGQLLSKNPDIYTFWNYRKKALLKIKSEQDESTEDKYESQLLRELELTESCMEKNSKSYGAWHHRGWSLMQMKNPNYQREIKQCEQALSLDERNFHVWDHWRIVCKLANLSVDDQIKFSDKKVKENFSNYSAWHYRSTLLPNSYPDPDGSLPIDNKKFLSELEMVHNAIFTDPDDQSSWFYRNWLFKRIDKDEKTFVVERFYFDKTFKKVFVMFDKSVVLNPEKVQISVGNEFLTNLKWAAVDGSNCDRFWVAEIDKIEHFCGSASIKVAFNSCATVELSNVKNSDDVYEFCRIENSEIKPGFCLQLTETEKKDLEFDLIQTLQLSQLESDKKWPLLTSIISMKKLNFKEYEKKIFDGLDSLTKIDPYRQHFYADLASKWRVEDVLLSNSASDRLNFVNLKLTALYHVEFMTNVTDLDISKNCLKSLSALVYLFNLRVLNVSSNNLTNLKGLDNLKRLQNVNVSSNFIESVEGLHPIVGCPSLKALNLNDNPIGKKLPREELLVKLRLGSLELML